jgi:hypothetical protein
MENNKIKVKRCLCCKKNVKSPFQKKFCISCSLYLSDLRRSLTYYRNEVGKLKLMIYGTKRGNERLRL